ncbi:MAG: hypothetical protein OEU26_22195 [Candidatus Tectomicrobia bacterium]|nr:hypothetical protein [Candidatus Tectomicrobia bacterium]
MVWDIAKILHIAVFFDLFDDSAVAELSQAGGERNGESGAQGLAVSAFTGVIEGGEAVDDGLPRNQAAQEDEIVSRIGQIVLDPLSRKGILKGLSDHGVDLFEGLRQVAISCL